jgi:HEAT repeat protein
MSKRRKMMLLLAGLALAFGAYGLLIRESEPSYHGRPLSERVLPLVVTDDPADPEAVQALRQLGSRSIPYLLMWMEYQTPAWREKLNGIASRHRALSWLGTDEEALDTLGEAAANAFAFIGPEGKQAIPALVRLLNDSGPGHNAYWEGPEHAARALGHLGLDALPPLLSALTNQNHTKRLWMECFWAIHRHGSNAAPAVAPIIQCLSDEFEGRRADAAWALGTLGLEPGLAVPALSKALLDTNAMVQFSALAALGDFRAEARPALPLLLPLLNDPFEGMRVNTAVALGQIKQEPALVVPALVKALQDPEPELRSMAAWALGEFGIEAVSALPGLQQALKDADEQVQSAASNVLFRIAPHTLIDHYGL